MQRLQNSCKNKIDSSTKWLYKSFIPLLEKTLNMYKKDFIDLVNNSFYNSEELYSLSSNINKPNPFYIGYGNPNSKILIFGKEKAFDDKNLLQLKYESIENPKQWKFYIDNCISINKTKFYESDHYVNVFFPYVQNQRSGHTWNKYNLLLKSVFSNASFENTDFLNSTFISEINYVPSRISQIKKFDDSTRIELLKSNFFKSFKITVLACGNYLKKEQIEDIFDVKFFIDKSEKRAKLIVYKNEERILINTRQLSMDVKNEYLKRISDLIIENL